MKYYKVNNEIRVIGEKDDDSGLGDQSSLVQKDWIEISYDEMMTITNPPKTDEEILNQKINELKEYLLSTDYKMTVDYFATLTKELQDNLTTLRAEAREFIRANESI